jgi:hypothetical protein
MVPGSMRGNLRFSDRATAHQFIALRFSERFSDFAHFLYFVGRQDGLHIVQQAKRGDLCRQPVLFSNALRCKLRAA